MTDYYSNSTEYHNDLDRFEAQRRAEDAERELNEAPVTDLITEIDTEIDSAEALLRDRQLMAERWAQEDAEIKAAYYSEYGQDYQERNDLYCMGMGC